MRLAASCLAWRPDEAAAAAAVLHAQGAHGVELVPTAIWGNWDEAFRADALPPAYAGLVAPSMQSLLFGLDDHRLFADAASEDRLVAHLGRLFAWAGRLGCRALVFGSPRQRRRGALDMDAALSRFDAFAERVAPQAAECGVLLCLEANPTAYGCDFVTGTPELVDVIARLRRPGIGLHFDTGTALLNGEDLPALIRRVGDQLDHLHVSAPRLVPVEATQAVHGPIAEALHRVGYRNWISVEMLRGPRGLDDLADAMATVRTCYAPWG